MVPNDAVSVRDAVSVLARLYDNSTESVELFSQPLGRIGREPVSDPFPILPVEAKALAPLLENACGYRSIGAMHYATRRRQ